MVYLWSGNDDDDEIEDPIAGVDTKVSITYKFVIMPYPNFCLQPFYKIYNLNFS